MDMKKRKAYKKWKKKGNKAFKWHDKVLDLMYNAQDHLLLSSTLWNYASFNNNEFGDLWNQEDLSIFSLDQKSNHDLTSGARGINGFCRPYAMKIAGIPQKIHYNRNTSEFNLKYVVNISIQDPTEIYVPRYKYPDGVIVSCSGAEVKEDLKNQKIFIHSHKSETITLKISKKQ